MIFFRRRSSKTPLDTVREWGIGEVLRVSSPVFRNAGRIPDKYTCTGIDISPPLKIENIPEDTVELALIMYDPDAPIGVFYHWLLYRIPPDKNELPENIPKKPSTNYGVQGVNDFGNIGYGGPCPPRGHGTHRYFFLVLALREGVDLGPGANVRELMDAVRDKVIGYGVVYGTYSR